jgi:uncharacterized membrane protein YhiD involved in acid resistance
MKSWKTTVTGVCTILVAVGGALQAMFDGNTATNPDWTAVIAAVTAGLGLITARDNNVTSEDVGAAKK